MTFRMHNGRFLYRDEAEQLPEKLRHLGTWQTSGYMWYEMWSLVDDTYLIHVVHYDGQAFVHFDSGKDAKAFFIEGLSNELK